MNTVIDVINPHIIGITESLCHKDINESEIHRDGYTTYRYRKIENVLKVVAFYFMFQITLESNYCSTLNIQKSVIEVHQIVKKILENLLS